MANTIDNSQDVIDSRDIIARIEELEEERQSFLDVCEDESLSDEERKAEGWDKYEAWKNDGYLDELKALKAVADECEGYGDWEHGEALIRESYFVDYIEELISDCYEMPKEMNSGSWPYRHMTMDYEAAAEEAKIDYIEIDFDGETYLMRA